ncbi:maltase 2-like isoform X2 [Ischnura elegans]|uniref:maltase 2-like isoform X2 n=1 Tax=Ischnura elegans TaxID=197161 RepID=UPI001ED8B87A|nr:maltase 2-like isoform X2 [Ischnura elegans]
MDGDKVNSKEADATELSDSGKYNHLPEETATSNMVAHKGGEPEEKHSPEGGKLLAGEDGVATEVKFISAAGDAQNNGDANISIEAVKLAFTGMGKEELMKFANDPFWIKLRWFLFVLFWLLWAAMLAVAIAIIVMAPKCAAPAPKTWWEESPLYQVNVPTFKDGSESQDGKGDLKGIKEKLDYFIDMGIQGIILSPIMTGSAALPDHTENFIDIDPALGTMEDFVSLTSELKEKGINVAIRFVPNHSGIRHPWFQKSLAREDPYTDYYVWADKSGTDTEGHALPPNNWVSVNGGSAWEFNSQRGQFYLHQFGTEQPDLNFHNENIIREFKDILKFWIDKGVNGFILDKADFLLEDPLLKDETFNTHSKETHVDYSFYNHYQTRNYKGSIDLLSSFKVFVKNLTESGMLGVTANISGNSLIQYYNEDADGVDLPFYNGITSTLQSTDAQTLRTKIEEWLFSIPNGTWPNWELGSADVSRLASRVSPSMVDGVHMVFMLLPGTPITQYGDELGIEGDANVAMPWSNSTNGGFSEASALDFAVSDSYATLNVERQLSAPESHYKVFKALIESRKSPSIMYGSLTMHVINETVLAYSRVKSGSPGYLVLFNMGDLDLTVSVSIFKDVPEDVTVLIRSVGFSDSAVQVKAKLKSSAVPLPSHGALVLTYVPSDKTE